MTQQQPRSRRDVIRNIIAIGAPLILLPTEHAVASGGATAGKYTWAIRDFRWYSMNESVLPSIRWYDWNDYARWTHF